MDLESEISIMPNPLLISEVTTRNFAALSRCFKDGNNTASVQIMKAEIRQIAREVAHWQLSGETKARIFLKPIEKVLVDHYGSHVGRRLYWDYVDAFWLQSWSVVPLPQPEPEPEPKANDEVNVECSAAT